MTVCTCQNKLNPYALRFVRGNKTRFQRLAYKFLQQKSADVGNNLRIEDVQECISMAYEVLIADASEQVAIPKLDTATAERCLEDYRAGRHQTVEEILNELP